MFWSFKDDAQSIFLDIDAVCSVTAGKKYNVILSPSLYWVKKLSLPLKYTHEVKKILPTLFEENLPEGNYNYYVYKEDDAFICFAYEDRKILEVLEQKGISPSDVKSFFFAQTALEGFDDVYRVNEAEVLKKEEGIFLLLPAAWYKDAKELPLERANTSKHAISLQHFSHIVRPELLYKIIAVLLAFVFVLFVELFVLGSVKESVVEESQNIFAQKGLKPTMMQNRSILSQYKSIYERQKKLRESLIALLKSNLKKGEHIEHIILKDGVLRVYFSGVSALQKARVTAALAKEKIPFKTEFEKEQLVVEVKL